MMTFLSDLRSYVLRVGVALSVLLNVVLGGNSNQTFSARNYEWRRNGHPNLCWFIDRLFFLEDSHCQDKWVNWLLIEQALRK